MAVVAIGTWMYDGSVPMQIKMFARPAADASSRYTEDETGNFVIDESSPIPNTRDGNVYYVGATAGGEFLSVQDAVAWADKQSWGPVIWTFFGTSRSSV